jgi:hypothetical protein
MRRTLKNHLEETLTPVRGIVHLSTELGVFVDVRGRRVFVPSNQTLSALRRLKPGKVVTLQINRNFALREGLASPTVSPGGGSTSAPPVRAQSASIGARRAS